VLVGLFRIRGENLVEELFLLQTWGLRAGEVLAFAEAVVECRQQDVALLNGLVDVEADAARHRDVRRVAVVDVEGVATYPQILAAEVGALEVQDILVHLEARQGDLAFMTHRIDEVDVIVARARIDPVADAGVDGVVTVAARDDIVTILAAQQVFSVATP